MARGESPVKPLGARQEKGRALGRGPRHGGLLSWPARGHRQPLRPARHRAALAGAAGRAERAFARQEPRGPGLRSARSRSTTCSTCSPTPRGAGLHVGHAVGYVGTDIVARRKRMEGFNVLHPMGWDAFGLPAEQYAIQTGKHPRETTAREHRPTSAASSSADRALLRLGRARSTPADPRYYRWTQWIFARLYDRGLAYQAEVPVWWCEELKTVLANEEVINGRSERGNHPCVRRPLKQWMLQHHGLRRAAARRPGRARLARVDQGQQREWIGRSRGRRDRASRSRAGEARRWPCSRRGPTRCGARPSWCSRPSIPLVARADDPGAARRRRGLRRAPRRRSRDLERTDLAKEKTGVFTGALRAATRARARGPRARIPSGRRLRARRLRHRRDHGACPATTSATSSSRRRSSSADASRSCAPPAGERASPTGSCFTGDGTADQLGPASTACRRREAKRATIALLESAGAGKRARRPTRCATGCSRASATGASPSRCSTSRTAASCACPTRSCPCCLPEMDDFTPSADGSPPLARAVDWVRDARPARRRAPRGATPTRCPAGPARAGTGCASWTRTNDRAPFSPEAERYWGPVDLYVGGAAHAVLHLLYARFWHKVLYDLGLVSTQEPFQKLFNQGMLTALAYQDAERAAGARRDEVEERGEAASCTSATGEPLDADRRPRWPSR